MQDDRAWYDWLTRRGITDSIITDFNIHWGTHPVIGDCIVIPVINEQGVCTFNKYRRNPQVDEKPKYVYDQGGRVTLYGYWKAREEKSLLVTEGEMDSLVAWSKNIPAVSSTGGAVSFQREWTDLLKDKDIVLCFDNDVTGGMGMVKTLEILPNARVLFLPDRPGIKDISDYVAGGGNLTELMRSAIHFDTLQEVIDHRSTRQATWQSTYFHDAYIEKHTTPTYARRDTDKSDEVSRAKTYPLQKLLKFTHNKALCPFHNEKTPSLHYYPKTNTTYCFGGCGRAYDSIDIYRKLHNCSFTSAIKALV